MTSILEREWRLDPSELANIFALYNPSFGRRKQGRPRSDYQSHNSRRTEHNEEVSLPELALLKLNFRDFRELFIFNKVALIG